MGRRLNRGFSRPDFETAGFAIYVRNGELAKTLRKMDDDVIPYLMRYGGQSIAEMDAQPFRRLIKIADGISRILEAENGDGSG